MGLTERELCPIMPKLPLSKPRTRVINFRVTEQEYNAIRGACTMDGAHNLSEFARAATLDLARSRAAGTACVNDQLHKLGTTLSHVDVTLVELVSTLKR